MKLRTTILLAMTFGSALAVGLTACGSSSDSGGEAPGGGAGGSGGSGGGDTTGPGTVPPEADKSAPAGDGSDAVVFAVSKLYLGDTDPKTGDASSSAWKTLGYNIDGKQSKASSTGLCKPAGNGTASVHNNGTGGIDNSFGANILPIITGLLSNPSDTVNEQIADGKFTLMLKVEKLGSAKAYNGLNTLFYAGGDLGATPTWDGTDKWPVICELLEGCALPDTKGDITKPKVKFASAYSVNDTWVSGSKGTVALSLAIKGVTLTLNIKQAVITMDMAGDHKSATGGVISGVLDTQELVDTIQSVVGRVEPSLCGSQTVESIIPTIVGASDIMSDGSQSDSSTCNGISVGIGFDAKVVQLGDVTAPSEPSPDPCESDAGTDASPE
jgi:hypothetical protein